MQRRHVFSLYALLIFAITGPACSLTSNLAARLTGNSDTTATRPRHFVVLPPELSTPATPAPTQATLPALISPLPIPSDATFPPPGEQLPATPTFPVPVDTPIRAEPTSALASEAGQVAPAVPTATPFLPKPRPRVTPTPDGLLAQLSELLNPFDPPTATATRPLRLAALPTIPPTPTDTPTLIPSPTPTATPSPTATSLPVPTDAPLSGPTDIPTLAPVAPAVPTPIDTPLPEPIEMPVPEPPSPSPAESTFVSPLSGPESTFTSPLSVPATTSDESAPASTSGYDFLLGEFYNSPTSNSFMVIYVAIVDASEIPIGDMKVIGTRLDHHLTYESPLSTWHFEGYNAPGEVIKSGNVKFEPPGGIETTDWVLHLADVHGNRISEDVPFNTDQTDKQWYFIKFKRKF